MNLKLIIGYDGKNYQGFQKNKNAKQTIQKQLNDTFTKYFGEKIDCIASGRTDKGVHALGQVLNFKVSKAYDLEVLKKELNHYLPVDIIVKNIDEVDEKFHSRFSAQNKIYQYRIWKVDGPEPPLFERNYVYTFDRVIDVQAMKEGADYFLGEHDFRGFSTDKTKKSTVRTIEAITIEETDREFVIKVRGNGFLYNMVRIIVGTLIEIGVGERKTDDIEKIFVEKDREMAGFTVPAHGLCLLSVDY